MTRQIAATLRGLLARQGAETEQGSEDRPWTDPRSAQYRDIASCL